MVDVLSAVSMKADVFWNVLYGITPQRRIGWDLSQFGAGFYISSEFKSQLRDDMNMQTEYRLKKHHHHHVHEGLGVFPVPW